MVTSQPELPLRDIIWVCGYAVARISVNTHGSYYDWRKWGQSWLEQLLGYPCGYPGATETWPCPSLAAWLLENLPSSCLLQHSDMQALHLVQVELAVMVGVWVSQHPGCECGNADPATHLLWSVTGPPGFTFGNQKSCPQGHERQRAIPAPYQPQHSGKGALDHENVRSGPVPRCLKHSRDWALCLAQATQGAGPGSGGMSDPALRA